LEKEDRVGGSVLLASEVDAGSDELMRTVRVLEGDCRRCHVDMRFKTEATPEMVASLKADTVVIATGGRWASTAEVGGLPVLTPRDVMEGRVPVPPRVAILGGGGTGLGVAVFLIRRGTYQATIIEESAKVGRDVNPFYLWRYTGMLRQQKAMILTGAQIRQVQGNVLFVTTPKGEVKVVVDALIQGLMKPEDNLARTLGGVAPEVRVIGDAKAPRRLQNAIHDGYRLGMEI
jgi:pyruvate/2-oxoglutarate dehydrogenase complex dihydrolipoamide dehydrogenase (E3) component